MTLTIGELAKRGGASVETIRYYERENLLTAPARNASGYRVYDTSAVARLEFIHRAQALGFTLREIRDLILLQTDDGADCTAVRDTARDKLRVIEEKITQLTSMKAELDGIIASCSGHRPVAQCEILECLRTPTC